MTQVHGEAASGLAVRVCVRRSLGPDAGVPAMDGQEALLRVAEAVDIGSDAGATFVVKERKSESCLKPLCRTVYGRAAAAVVVRAILRSRPAC